MSLLNPRKVQVTIRAAEESRLLSLSLQDIQDLMRRRADIRKAIKSVARRHGDELDADLDVATARRKFGDGD